jgi:hypothetical protein
MENDSIYSVIHAMECNRVTFSDVMNLSDVFFGVSPCSGTSWFKEYTSQISMSNISFHAYLEKGWGVKSNLRYGHFKKILFLV